MQSTAHHVPSLAAYTDTMSVLTAVWSQLQSWLGIHKHWIRILPVCWFTPVPLNKPLGSQKQISLHYGLTQFKALGGLSRLSGQCMVIIFLFLPESAKVGIILVNKSTGDIKILLFSTLRVIFSVGYISVRLHRFGFSPIEAIYIEKEREVCKDSVGSCFLRNQRCLKKITCPNQTIFMWLRTTELIAFLFIYFMSVRVCARMHTHSSVYWCQRATCKGQFYPVLSGHCLSPDAWTQAIGLGWRSVAHWAFSLAPGAGFIQPD